MVTVQTKIGEGGRIVIPADFRKALGWCVGDDVIIRLTDGEVHVYTLDHAIDRVQS